MVGLVIDESEVIYYDDPDEVDFQERAKQSANEEEGDEDDDDR